MHNEEIKNLADKIAQMLSTETKKADLSALFAGLEKINHRLDKLEHAQTNPQSAIRNTQSTHPSLDKFGVAEAIADEIFGKLQKEKACTFEPSGKPCDHCSMCNSRGF
ncbi:MAG TPA: hypothetical protein VGQ55_14220 [Pyrinomonadaceae bacterium]|jgi:hypothetical protein|nr:hypothetical protein [Pyrinomonadaceae bacterium]